MCSGKVTLQGAKGVWRADGAGLQAGGQPGGDNRVVFQAGDGNAVKTDTFVCCVQ